MTFKDIKKGVAEYFGLPEKDIFFTNEHGQVYMLEMRVSENLFPVPRKTEESA